MADSNTRDIISHKGKRKQNYSLGFKKEVLAFAEVHGNRPASRRFQIDEKRVREWGANKIGIQTILETKKGKARSRLNGAGRKPLNVEMEEVVMEWIDNRRTRGLRVSCKLIMKKAEMVYQDITQESTAKDFKGSRGWLCRFMKRNGLSLRRKTSVAQQDPERLVSKIVSYVIQVRRLQMKHNYSPCNIIAMDETPVWCDMVSETTVDA